MVLIQSPLGALKFGKRFPSKEETRNHLVFSELTLSLQNLSFIDS